MSDFYEEQISDLEDHVGGLEIDLKDANQENKRLRDALEAVVNVYKVAVSDGDAYARASYVAKKALETNQ